MIVKTISKVNWPALKGLHSLDKEEANKLLQKTHATTVPILPQIMAFLSSTITLYRAQGVDGGVESNDMWDGTKAIEDGYSKGLIDINRTLNEYVKKIKAEKIYFSTGELVTLDIFTGIMKLLTYPIRGSILPPATVQIRQTRFATNVPLFYSAFKELRNVGYEEWDWENADDNILAFTLDERCASLVQLRVEGCPEFTIEELTEIRDNAAQVKSGARVGSVRPLQSITTAYGSNSFPGFAELPPTAKVLLIQTWLFMPKFRHSLGIYNLHNLDNYPEFDIVETELFTEATKYSKKDTKGDTNDTLPWDL